MNPKLAPRTSRPYNNIGLLLDIYLYMQKYEKKHGFKPTIAEMVVEGFSPSTSVVRYYLDRMERLAIIHIPTLNVKRKDGSVRRITPSRSIQLLPLADADPLVVKAAIQKGLLKEAEHVSV